MARIEKTVFISYRRTDVYTALAVYENLKNQGYDVFFDYRSISSGDFEQIITSNIRARAHFIIILTPTALDRCSEPGDWLRREIETAIDEKRNIVPLFFKGFRFGASSKSGKSKWMRLSKPEILTGKLKDLSRYNGLNVHEDYFEEAMNRLREEFLNKPLDTVLHPVSTEVQKVVKEEQKAADDALKYKEVAKEPVRQAEDKPVQKKELPEPVVSKTEKRKVQSPAPTKVFLWGTIGGVAGILALIAIYIWSESGLGGKVSDNNPQLTQVPLLTASATLESINKITPSTTKTSIQPPPSQPPTTPVPSVTSSPTVDNVPIDCTYTFQEGDNLRDVAVKFGLDGNKYVEIKNFFGGELAVSTGAYPGQILAIPTILQEKCLNEGGYPRMAKDAKGIPMMLVPVGELTIDTKKVLTLDDYYYIDEFEVTNAFYKLCVDAGVCASPTSMGPESRPDYFEDQLYKDYPVIYVNWNMAKTYCQWRGAHLPTNVEWVHGARGMDERIYPWGNHIDESYANYNNNIGGTSAVGSYEAGKSPFGVYDMAGNVWEWVSSSDGSYSFDPEDPLRGGSWINDETYLRIDFKAFGVSQDEAKEYYGFRCASDSPFP